LSEFQLAAEPLDRVREQQRAGQEDGELAGRRTTELTRARYKHGGSFTGFLPKRR